MAVQYFDSSAVVKRYVVEKGTAWVLNLTAPAAGNELFIAHVTGVEVVSALVRKLPPLTPIQLAQAINDFTYDYQNHYQKVEISEAVVLTAMRLAQVHHLRGYDAVQLAAALELHALRVAAALPALTFISADTQLLAAATGEGLNTDDPTLHP